MIDIILLNYTDLLTLMGDNHLLRRALLEHFHNRYRERTYRIPVEDRENLPGGNPRPITIRRVQAGIDAINAETRNRAKAQGTRL
jgi:hypothetical protein